ncbi:MAG TPA: anaerobic ribonucleoside-triphosphate reductase [Nitrososphaerales archaeon]|nr:anaerobic ribonucleoside-triphosphate reductase [Nitrososphaerales archaeon]
MSSPRRVRTIYSVIASPNRLDILRILNTKGPLSYSELKTLAGFKSKKESGKFAYHLRKLVKQTLISLNRAERKYTATSLGRLVLNLTKQIEEQSMLESGKLYVRSSRQALEEFNADKILQSLVREAGMPVEIAQKIASETEARVYKFQTAYLTAPLIREIVNSILVEHGYEEYRHKLTRLGLPVADVAELILRAGDSSDSIDSVLSTTSGKVFSEYAILTKIPRDVSDAHLSGDIHISSLGTWSLMPDTVYLDLNALYSNPYNLGSKISNVPRMGMIKNFDSALESLEILASIVSREVSNEVCLDNLISYLSKLYSPRSQEEQIRMFSRMLSSLSMTTGIGRARSITFRIGEPQKDEDVPSQLELRDSLLQAYSRYIEVVPVPTIHLVVSPGRYFDRRVVEGIAHIILKGGDIALESDGKHSFSGLKLNVLGQSGSGPDGVAFLQNLALNLPRLAYESNKDETYFRAKLALLLQTAVNALVNRKDHVRDTMKKGLLPALSQIPVVSSLEDMPFVINMIGLNEAISSLMAERESLSRHELAIKILDTASKVTTEKASKLGGRAFVSMIHSDGFERLSEIDGEKYGRSQETRHSGYQEGIVASDRYEDEKTVREIAELCKSTSGGTLVSLGFPKDVSDNLNFGNIVASVYGKLPFVRFSRNPEICKKCGMKVFSGGRCASCKSTSLITQPLLV